MRDDGLGAWLRVPNHKLDEIRQQHSTQTNQMRATVEYWLSVHPTPSWRRLIRALEYSEEHQAVEKVKPYLEPLTGKYWHVPLYVPVLTRYHSIMMWSQTDQVMRLLNFQETQTISWFTSSNHCWFTVTEREFMLLKTALLCQCLHMHG